MYLFSVFILITPVFGQEPASVFGQLLEYEPGATMAFKALSAGEQEQVLEDLAALLKSEPPKHFGEQRYLPGRTVKVYQSLGLPSDHPALAKLRTDASNLEESKLPVVLEMFQAIEDNGLVKEATKRIVMTKSDELRKALSGYLVTTASDNVAPLFRKLLLNSTLTDDQKGSLLIDVAELPSDKAMGLFEEVLKQKGITEPLRKSAITSFLRVPTDKAANRFLELIKGEDGKRLSASDLRSLVSWRLKWLKPKLSAGVMANLYDAFLERELAEDSLDERTLHLLLGNLQDLGEEGAVALRHVPNLLKRVEGSLEAATLRFAANHKSVEVEKLLKGMLQEPRPNSGKEFEGSDYSRWLDRQLLIAGHLSGSEDEKEIIDSVAESWAEGFRSAGQQSPGPFLEHFESSRQRLTGAQQEKFEAAVFDKLFSKELSGSPCEAACKTAESYAYWAQKRYLSNPEYRHTAVSWEFALNSLGMLFLLKSAPYCEKVKPIAHQLVKHYFPKRSTDEFPKPKNTSGFGGIQELAKTSRAITRDHKDFDKILAYGKLFYILLMREIGAQSKGEKPVLTGVDLTQVEEELALMEASIENELEGFKNPKSLQDEGNGIYEPKNFQSMVNSHTGSYFETFMMSMTKLVVPLPKDASELMDKVLAGSLEEADGPLNLVYGFGRGYSPSKANPRGAAARAVPFHLSYYLEAKTADEKVQYADYLFQALENHNKHSGSMIFHIARNQTHRPNGYSEYDGIAPYYYYPSTPAVSLSYKVLKEDPAVSEEKKAKLEKMEVEYLRKLRMLANRESRFLELGTDRYPSSPSYVNPLAGLALLTYCDKQSWGLLTPKANQVSTKAVPIADQEPTQTSHGIKIND